MSKFKISSTPLAALGNQGSESSYETSDDYDNHHGSASGSEAEDSDGYGVEITGTSFGGLMSNSTSLNLGGLGYTTQNRSVSPFIIEDSPRQDQPKQGITGNPNGLSSNLLGSPASTSPLSLTSQQPTQSIQQTQIVQPMTPKGNNESDEIFSFRSDIYNKMLATIYAQYANQYSTAITNKVKLGASYSPEVEAAFIEIAKSIGMTL